MFGKKVFISQDGVDWRRDKWPWYGKLYLIISAFLTAYLPDVVIFDNEIAKRLFEKKFRKKFEFIAFGSEVNLVYDNDDTILKKYGLLENDYYLFVGRFIPDKGLHYLIPAFTSSNSKKKLVLIGGPPNPSEYEKELHKMANENVVFAGYVYGDDVTRLMLKSYCYIQPSDIEGLSPVILSVMGLGVPLIVSDIEENVYVVQNTAIKFEKANIKSLTEKINYAENNYSEMKELAQKAKKRALSEFNWEKVTDDHIALFSRSLSPAKDVV
jgi:glycosyltransferase involved in cell wall biosynthesis